MLYINTQTEATTFDPTLLFIDHVKQVFYPRRYQKVFFSNRHLESKGNLAYQIQPFSLKEIISGISQSQSMTKKYQIISRLCR